MADDKQGRDKQANDEERRQRTRDLEEELERWDDTEPVDNTLDTLQRELEEHEYPVTSSELAARYRNRELETQSGRVVIGDVLARDDDEQYQSAADVRDRIERSLSG